MEKTKLTICIEDEEYKQRFVKCMMKHYKDLFEIHVINQMSELKTEADEKYGAVIIEDNEYEGKDLKNQVILVLEEECRKQRIGEKIYYTEKYQEVYKIIEELQKAINENISVENKRIKKEKIQRIGVFSLTREKFQIPFTTLIAEILGENNHVLVVDLQAFSGLVTEIEAESFLGMEDLISVAATENYTAHRLLASIGHEQKWDYIYPVKNTSCLTEVGLEIYQKMLDILEKEQPYTYEIINFGALFPGMMELMESCQQIHILTEKKGEPNYREHSFLEEMHRRGKEEFLQKIIWTEIFTETMRTGSWKQISKQWLWGSIGDLLREKYWVEYTDGTDM